MPVPKVEVKADELFAVPAVVVMLEPPPIVGRALIVTVKANFATTPSESVTVTDSRYVPVSIVLAAVITPVLELMLIPVIVGVKPKVLVPVAPLAVNPNDVPVKPLVVAKLRVPVTVAVGFTKIVTTVNPVIPKESVTVMVS